MLQLLVFLDVLEHPVAAHVVLVTTADTEHFTFVSDQGAAELGNEVVVVQHNLLTRLLVHIVKVNVFGAPFEVMHKFARAVTLLEDERVVQQLRELGIHVHV